MNIFLTSLKVFRLYRKHAGLKDQFRKTVPLSLFAPTCRLSYSVSTFVPGYGISHYYIIRSTTCYCLLWAFWGRRRSYRKRADVLELATIAATGGAAATGKTVSAGGLREVLYLCRKAMVPEKKHNNRACSSCWIEQTHRCRSGWRRMKRSPYLPPCERCKKQYALQAGDTLTWNHYSNIVRHTYRRITTAMTTVKSKA